MASILVPVFYVIIVFGGLFIFGRHYRNRAANKVYEPYFPRHVERDIYVTLLQKSDPPAPDPLLKSALVRRAMTDITRIVRLREDKPALQNLHQKGSVGDDIWNSLLAAEKELEAEIMEVAAEANSFLDGWGQVIFQTASEMLANEKTRSYLEKMPQVRAEHEAKYGHKLKGVKYLPLPGTPSTPAIAMPTTPSTPLSSKSPLPTNPSTPKSPKSPNNLAPPATPSDGALSSDGEGPRTPSKSSKKAKKRK
ncbi:Pre protein translocase subunit Sec66-domain-containing protein [Amylostereum chailletii]|nr:Pre protein translocase subunit Sec66-domain-containing protein [Amylostereum chailletii]